MPAPDLVKARWTPGWSCQLPDGTVLNPGDTHTLSRTEAEASDHWEPVETKSAAKPAKTESES